MNFLLRVDDVGWSPKRPDKRDPGLKLARQFHEVLNGRPWLAAVIPSTLDDEGVAWLQTPPAGMTVAMHGSNHAPTEFRNLDVEAMRQRIKRGKSELDGVRVEDMVLPFNQYESGLSEACSLEGIRRVWGGGDHRHTDPSSWPTPPQPYRLEEALFVPSWKPTYASTLWRMSDVCPALHDTLPAMLDLPGKAVLTLHITWESAFTDTLEGVGWLLDVAGDGLLTVEEYVA